MTHKAKPYSPPRRVRAAIGDIIMVGAEIDHLITLALFKLTNIDFTVGFALLDRATIGTKLNKLRYFVEFQKDDSVREDFKRMETHLEPFLKLRNTLAHGVLVGISGEDIIFMLTADYSDNMGSFTSGALGYTEQEFYIALDDGRMCARVIGQLFDVKPLHETTQYTLRKGKGLTLKASRKNNPSKPQSPPQSSPD